MPKKRTLKNPAVSGSIPREDLRQVVNGYHVLSESGNWQVKGAGHRRATRVFSTKRDAVAFAKEMGRARNAQVIIHGKDGRISRMDAYGRKVANYNKR